MGAKVDNVAGWLGRRGLQRAKWGINKTADTA